MENHEVPLEQSAPEQDPMCRNCGAQPYLEAHLPTMLCADCRQEFIRYPIPKWIWLFGTGILVLILFSLFNLPKYVSGTYHLAKGEKLIKDQRYMTAQKELIMARESFPESMIINAKLWVVAAENFDFDLLGTTYNKLKKANLTDQDLINEIKQHSAILSKTQYSDTSLNTKLKLIRDSIDVLQKIYQSADSLYPNDVLIVGYTYADKLYDLGRYKDAEVVLRKLIAEDAEFYPAKGLLIAVLRNTDRYDEAIAVCNETLKRNKELVPIIAAKAKVELKRNNDQAAARYAAEAMHLNEHDEAAMEMQAMVDFYAGRKNQATKLLHDIRLVEKQIGDSTVSTRLVNIFNGTEKFR